MLNASNDVTLINNLNNLQTQDDSLMSSVNLPFSMHELNGALSGCKKTSSPGPDQIDYNILTHLPSSSLQCLLNVVNSIWHSGEIPKDWKKSIIIPIPKNGKDPKNSKSYRPIALTSCIGKLMEHMVQKRLSWYL